jgi:hypothetical protein
MDKSKLLRWLELKLNEIENAPKRKYEEELIFKGGKMAYKMLYEFIVDGKFD